MMAPFVGRRSCAGQREAAALISQNRHRDMWSERTKSTCPATVFFFPRRAGQAVVVYWIKEADNHKGLDLVCYRLCVCASGSLITVIFSCFTLISVSCLHFGQYRGKFWSSVSSLNRIRVLFLQTGQYTHAVVFISSPPQCLPFTFYKSNRHFTNSFGFSIWIPCPQSK